MLLKCYIKEDISRQGEAKRYLVGLRETRFVECHVSIPALVAEAGGGGGGGGGVLAPTFFQGDPYLRDYFYNNTSA